MRKISSALLGVLVVGAMLGVQCIACASGTAAQPSGHGCCTHPHKGSCHVPSPGQLAQTHCPALTLEPPSFHRAPISLGLVVSPLPVAVSIPDLGPNPESASGLPAAGALLVHAPPDLYLLNSSLLV